MDIQPPIFQQHTQPLIAIVIKAEEPPKPPEPEQYVIQSGDNLTKIAKAEDTTVARLWAKNKELTNPDLIEVGAKLLIPLADEKLEDRALPVPVVQISSTKPRVVGVEPRGASPGNTYTYGYCTWYVKNRRPDLPNNLGNAETWLARAAAQGIPTGSTPRVGAVGQRGNHVVYVEAVNGDGTIVISEMNYQAWNVQSSRTVPASNFSYIY